MLGNRRTQGRRRIGDPDIIIRRVADIEHLNEPDNITVLLIPNPPNRSRADFRQRRRTRELLPLDLRLTLDGETVKTEGRIPMDARIRDMVRPVTVRSMP